MKKRSIALIACMMVLCLAVGGTIAWLTASTDAVTNTFTVGDINIDLKEDKLNADGTLDASTAVTSNEYAFVPGATLNKRPYVTVKANSEACYLFIKVTATNNTVSGVNILSWAIDSGWTQMADTTDVWYREVAATTADTSFDILAEDKVTVSGDVTKDMVAAINASNPTLSFDAAAVQSENIADVAAAYAQVQW